MLDLAVAALALLVIGSLGLLAWTLGVSAARATRDGRRRVASARRSVAKAQIRIRSGAAATEASLATLTARTTLPKPGDEPNA